MSAKAERRDKLAMECDAPPRLIELRGGNVGEIVAVEDVGVEPVLQKTRHDGAG